MENINRLLEIAKLIAKEKTGILTIAEEQTLQNWVTESKHNNTIYVKLLKGETIQEALMELKRFDAGKAYKKVESRIFEENISRKIIRFIPKITKYAAAIALLVISSYYALHLFNNAPATLIAQSTIKPGSHQAVLTTAQNIEMVLDSTVSDQIIKEQLADISTTASTLSYHRKDSIENSSTVTQYNTLSVPLGGEYTLLLSDGTEVILNSGSRLRYPVVFNGPSRVVELQGEAYFKVSKSHTIPFIVNATNINIHVYGTIFNVSAYRNESQVQTTLVEGIVGVSIIGKQATTDTKIRPGQQFTYHKSTLNSETKEVDTNQYIAWTKGQYIFNNEPIDNILRTLARWYKFEYNFKEANLRQQRFTLSMNKYDQVAKTLKMISISSNIEFQTNGNIITIVSKETKVL